jgi:non-specific serine/threonine protein kinase
VVHRAAHESAVAGARAALGEAGFAAADAAGRSLSLEEAIAAAGAVVAAAPSRPETGEAAGPRLTRRERDVLRLVAEGRSDREIAAALSLGQRTVESHVLHILQKLGADSRTAAAVYAVRHGLA